ncbi:MAG: efflux RND transporter permease subunit, partial [Candidatus Binatia bacterium]
MHPSTHPAAGPPGRTGAWSRFLEIPLRFPRLVLALAAVVTAVLGIHAPRLAVDGSVESLLVSGDPERAYHEEVERVFGSDETSRIGIFAADVFAPSTLAKIDRLSRELARIDGVEEVMSLTTVAGAEMTDRGLRAGRLLRELPADATAAAAFRAKVLATPLYGRSLVSADGRSTAVSVLFRPMSDEALVDVEGRIRLAARAFAGPEEVAISGIPTVKVEGARRIEEDIRTFSALALALVVVILSLMFRSARGVLLPLVAVGMGVLWTNGLMALLGQPITIGSLVLNPLLMAIGVAYAMYVMSRYFHESLPGRPSRETVRRALGHVGLPVAIATFTTLAGFATLVPHPVPTIRDLGLWSLFGISAIFLASVTVIPAALVLLPPPRPARPSRRAVTLDAVLERLAGFTLA